MVALTEEKQQLLSAKGVGGDSFPAAAPAVPAVVPGDNELESGNLSGALLGCVTAELQLPSHKKLNSIRNLIIFPSQVILLLK